jgi:LPXTG-motif cell wall-anchored protein
MKYALAFAVLGLTAAGGFGSTAFAQSLPAQASSNAVAESAKAKPKPAPAPLIAAGIPGVLALGGAYLAVRRRRRKG